MNLIKKELIEKAALENCEYNQDSLRQYDKHFVDAFQEGVEFAESQLEELVIKFIEWAGDNRVSLSVKDQRNEFQQVWYQGKNISAKKLFQQFIKERNGRSYRRSSYSTKSY